MAPAVPFAPNSPKVPAEMAFHPGPALGSKKTNILLLFLEWHTVEKLTFGKVRPCCLHKTR